MNRNVSVVLVAVASMVGIELAAQSTVYDVAYSSSRPTAVSGQETGVGPELSFEDAPIVSLTFWEYNDKPCGAAASSLLWNRFENGTMHADQDAEGGYTSGCEGSGGSTVNNVSNVTVNAVVDVFRAVARTAGVRRVGNGRVNANINNSIRDLILPDGHGLTGLRICVRSGNGRLKGVHVSYARVTPGGLRDAKEMRFERPRCNQWEALAACPDGQIATGVVIHHSDPDIIAGVGLKCARPRFTARAVAMQPPPPTTPAPPPPAVQQQSGLQLYRTPVSRTQVSGDAGTGTLLFSDESNAFVTGITVWERNNQPCRLRVTYRTDPDSGEHTKTFNRCNGNTTSDPWSVDIDDGVLFSDNSTYGVGGLRICQRRQNGRLKGIQLFAARIDGNTVQHDNSIDPDEELSNCNDWQTPRRSCPSNQIAAGVVVHYRDNNNGADEITGLHLRCARTTLTP